MTNFVRRGPFNEVLRLPNAMVCLSEDSHLRPFSGGLFANGTERTAANVYETADAIVVKSAIPGIKSEDMNISIPGGTLVIKVETRTDKKTGEEDCSRQEYRFGSFSRSLVVPVPVTGGKAEASFKDGILTLTMPKPEEIRPKAIKLRRAKR